MKVKTNWWGVAIHAENAAELDQLQSIQQSTGPKAVSYYEDGDVELVLPGTDEWGDDGDSVGCLVITR